MQLPTILLRIARKSLKRFVPRRWMLPFEYYLYAFDRDCEPELRHLEGISQRRDVAIDVGASIGFYSYKMSKLFSKVYSFEVNPEMVEALQSFSSNKIVVIPKGLSSKIESATLYIPFVNTKALTGWASLYVSNCPGADAYQEKVVELINLDSLAIRSVSLIKIDVEGHELEVLKGAEHTLIESRPIVIVEVKEKNLGAVQNFFSRIHYQKQKLENLTGKEGSAENWIFLPTHLRLN